MSAQPQPSEPRLLPQRELTLKQRLFVDAYCGEARGNATEAARIAGYDVSNDNTFRVIAAENLAKPSVKAAINERLDALAMDRGEIVAELSEVGRSDWRDEDNRLSAGDKVRALAELAKIRRMTGPETNIQVNVQVNQVQILEQTAQELAEKHGVSVELARERLMRIEELRQLVER
jgi:hypothetical protein